MRKTWVNGVRIAAATALLAAGASAARAEELVVANVPFTFVVGKTELPAGEYVVKQISDEPAVVSIESADGRHVASAITIVGESAGLETRPALVFKKLDGRYFLERMTSDDGLDREFVLRPVPMERNTVAATPNP